MHPSIDGIDRVELVGRGGFSSVYRARQVALNRVVAVKVIDAIDSVDSNVRLFEKECRSIGQLDWCPQIVTVFHVGQTADGMHYLIMEYAPGGSMADVLKASGPLTESAVCRIGQRIATALAAAHAAGILHRDVKPANILLSRADEPVLADFGIARLQGESVTPHGGLSGTIAYTAPEILQGGEATAASDVYSLGATMFTLLAGRSPFAGTGDTPVGALIARAVSGPPADYDALGVSDGLARVLARCMARDPRSRVATAAELADLLEAGSTTDEGAEQSEGTQVTVIQPFDSELSVAVDTPPAGGRANVRDDVQDPFATPRPRPRSIRHLGLRWPSASEYTTAVQTSAVLAPRSPFEGITVVRDELGLPSSASGQNAIVFEVGHSSGRLALRCFTRAPEEAGDRYFHVAEAVRRHHLDAVAPAYWVDDGITVGRSRWPVLLMPWVPGVPLDLAVEDMLDRSDELRRLAAVFLDLQAEFVDAGVAHGDLQCGNMLVDGAGSLRLVDLDGFYTPAITSAPDETGHPHFQHPRRGQEHWGSDVDAFSVLVIFASLRALAADPSLWRFHNDENLVLSMDDYRDPDSAAALAAMADSPDAEVGRMAMQIAAACRERHPLTLPGLLKALPLPDAHPLARAARVDLPAAATLTEAAALPARQAAIPQQMTKVALSDTRTGSTGTPWWDEAGVDEATVVSPMPTPRREPAPSGGPALGVLFARTTVGSGALGGLIFGLLACVLHIPIAAVLPVKAGPIVFVVLVGAALGAGLSLLPSASMAQWSKALRLGLAGAGVGAIGSLLGLVLLQTTLPADAEPYERIPAGLLVGVWVCVGGSIGVTSGIVRLSGRLLAAGFAGGLLGGVLGGLLHWSTEPVFIPTGNSFYVLEVDTQDVRTVLAIAAACLLVGLAIGAADRITRRSWLTVIEGPQRGREVILDRRVATIGSSASADLRLPRSGQIHPEHVRIEPSRDGRFVLRNAGRIEVNGHEISPGSSISVSSEDVVRIEGSFVRMGSR